MTSVVNTSSVAHCKASLAAWTQRWLPSGSQLPEALQQSRHRLIAIVLAIQVPILMIVGVINHRPIAQMLLEIGLAVELPLVASVFVSHKRSRAAIAAFGLMSAAAVLVDVSGGKIEAHFLFFVLLPLVALYQDWLPFLVAVGVVVGHHAIIGTLAAHAVFDHPSAQRSPVIWSGIHAAFVVALIAVLIIHWNAAEAAERALKSALGELQQAQTQLVQAQKLESIGQLAAGIAHEINTPIQFVGDNIRFLDTAFQDLASLLTNLDELIVAARERADLGDLHNIGEIARRADAQRTTADVGYLLQEIPLAVGQSIGGIDRVAEIVRALKGVAHPDADQTSQVDLNQLIADTVIVSRNEWRHSATLNSDYDPGLPMVGCAAGPMSQVVLNIIVNAAHAIQDRFGDDAVRDGQITVNTRFDDESACISIADNGTGMPEDVRIRIFDPFFTTKDVGRGTGQGMSISHGVIVNQHGGTIKVDSTVGVGTTFSIRIPIIATASQTAAEPNQVAALTPAA